MKKIAVIGSGPAGLMSIYSLFEEEKDIKVVLFEAQNEIAKRIKVSGNGRCNFFHQPIEYHKYSSFDVAKKYMSLFMTQKERIFNELGIIYYQDEEGRCYPTSNSSKTIIYLFEAMLKKYNVQVELNTKIEKLIQQGNQVKLKTSTKDYLFDRVILATGGLSYLYDAKEKLNFLINNDIKYTALSPSLTPIKTERYLNKALEGKRFKVKLSLTYKNNNLFEERGEILFKKDGISGIVTFNLSSHLARLHLNDYKDYVIHIDFAPDLDDKALKEVIYSSNFSLEDNLMRLFIKELKDELLMHKNVDLITLIKDYTLNIKELYPFKDSQVTSGGIDISTINDDLSLTNNPCVYPCGELLDVDGECGGYNIAFCLASGYQVGKNLIKSLKNL